MSFDVVPRVAIVDYLLNELLVPRRETLDYLSEKSVHALVFSNHAFWRVGPFQILKEPLNVISRIGEEGPPTVKIDFFNLFSIRIDVSVKRKIALIDHA